MTATDRAVVVPPPPLGIDAALSVRVLALDLSLTGTGVWCHGCGPSTIKTAKVTLEERLGGKGAQRLASIEDSVATHFVDERPDVVVVEGYSYGSKAGREFMGELGGVIRVRMFREHLPWAVVSPQQRALFATGKGNAAKDEVLMRVTKWPDFEGTNNNEADAFVLKKMADLWYGGGIDADDVIDYQRKVTSRILWPELGS